MKLFIFSALAFVATSAAKAAEMPDTLIANCTVDSVAVKETENATTIVLTGIEGADGPVTYIFPKKDGAVVRTYNAPNEKKDKVAKALDTIDGILFRPGKWSFAFGGLGFGWNLAIDKLPADMELRANKSWDITWLYAAGVEYRMHAIKASVSFGLGFDWKNYKMTTGPWFLPAEDKSVVIGAAPEGVNARSSRLKVFSLSVPVIYRQDLPVRLPYCNESMWIAVGPIVNFNTHGSLLNKWIRPDGVEVEQNTNNIFQRKVAVDVYGAIFLNGWFGAYVRYSPMTILRKGPEFKSVAIGLTLSW